MTFGPDYVAEFLAILVEYLQKEQRDPHARAVVEMRNGEMTVVLEASSRSLVTPLAGPVYHYLPDGSDAGYHATWLAELFNEEADWIDAPNPLSVEQAGVAARGTHDDVTIEDPGVVFFSSDVEVQN